MTFTRLLWEKAHLLDIFGETYAQLSKAIMLLNAQKSKKKGPGLAVSKPVATLGSPASISVSHLEAAWFLVERSFLDLSGKEKRCEIKSDLPSVYLGFNRVCLKREEKDGRG